jgi:hypothetical protein
MLYGNMHPLSHAMKTALWRNQQQVLQLLVDRGASVNDRAFSFLQRLARHGKEEGVHFLLRNGADVNTVDGQSGETPLWAAAENGHVQLVKILLVAGAGRSLFVCDNNLGETPLEAANRQGHTGIVYELFRAGVEDWLKKHYALKDGLSLSMAVSPPIPQLSTAGAEQVQVLIENQRLREENRLLREELQALRMRVSSLNLGPATYPGR